MLHTWITDDVIAIATGFILFSSLTSLSTIVTCILERKKNLSKKTKMYRSGRRICIRNASIGFPDAAM